MGASSDPDLETPLQSLSDQISIRADRLKPLHCFEVGRREASRSEIEDGSQTVDKKFR